MLSAYVRAEDLINIGAYQTGNNRMVDLAIARHDEIMAYLRQEREENANFSRFHRTIVKH
jgi:flagellar biosynthesis/type III secretory pathway ATPase